MDFNFIDYSAQLHPYFMTGSALLELPQSGTGTLGAYAPDRILGEWNGQCPKEFSAKPKIWQNFTKN